MANKRFQFLRGKTIFDSMEVAKQNLANKVATLLPGEPAIAYYHTNKDGDDDKILALFGVGGGDSGSTVFYDSHSVDAAIASAQAAASTEVKQGTGVNVSKVGGENGRPAQYTVAANLTMQYNPAVPASEGVDAKPATITLKSAVRDGEAQETYGTINVSDIVGNGVLHDSSYNENTGILTLNFNNASGGTTSQNVDLTKMLDLNDVVIGSGSQNYLSASHSPTSGESGQFVLDANIVAVSNATDSNTGLVDAKDVKDYVDAAVAGKNVAAKGDDVFIAASASGNTVTVTGTYGTFKTDGTSATNGIAKVSDVANAISGAIGELDATVSSDATNVNVTISEVDGKLSGVTVSEDYATVTVNDTTLNVNNDSCLVKGSDITTVGTYASNLVSAEAAARQDAINALSAATVGGTGKIVTTISENAGKISATAIDLTASNVAATTVEATDDKVAVSGTTVAAQIESLATSVKAAMDDAKAAHNVINEKSTGHVTVSGATDAKTGKVTYTISENDIASAALLGATADTKDASTAFGKIAAEADTRKTNDDVIRTAVGLSETYGHVTTTGNYTSGATSIAGEIAALDAQVKTNADGIQALKDAKVSVSASTDTESAKYIEVSTNDNKTVYTVKAKGIDAAITASIEALDATISQSGSTVTAAGNNVNITITEENGKLTGVTASVDVFDCGEWE